MGSVRRGDGNQEHNNPDYCAMRECIEPYKYEGYWRTTYIDNVHFPENERESWISTS